MKSYIKNPPTPLTTPLLIPTKNLPTKWKFCIKAKNILQFFIFLYFTRTKNSSWLFIYAENVENFMRATSIKMHELMNEFVLLCFQFFFFWMEENFCCFHFNLIFPLSYFLCILFLPCSIMLSWKYGMIEKKLYILSHLV